MKRTLLFLILTLLTALPAAAQKPPLPSPVIPDGLGYNIHFTHARPGELEMLAGSGATIVRMDFAWNGIEREKGVYDFSAYERLTDDLEKHKIRPLYILDYWNHHYDDGLSPHTPEGRAAFAKWAAAAAVHFQDRGILWEMYNEPNIFFWKPEPKPEDYILLALEVGKALREAAPNELYIGPATSEIDLDFLEKCFQGGLLEYWDAVSVHPYRQTGPETAIPEYAKLRWMIDKYAPAGKHIPILSAEWGYSSVWHNYTDELQGKMLPRQWMTNLACGIPVSIWYDWHDDGLDPKEPEHHFGTTNHEYHADRELVYDPKPSYIAAKTFNETFKGFQYNKRLFYGDPGMSMYDNVYIFMFTKDDEVRLAVWTAAKEPQKIYISCSPGTFRAVSYLGEELPDVEAKEFSRSSGMNVTVTDGPIYLIPKTPNAGLSTAAKWETRPMVEYTSRYGRIPVMGFSITGFEWENVSLEQVTIPVPNAPIYVRTPMIEANELVIRIDNPEGVAFRGAILLENMKGITLSPEDAEPRKIEIAEGETRIVERFPVVAREGDRYTLCVAIYDDGWKVTNADDETVSMRLYAVPQRTYRPMDFSKIESWGIFPDGDANVESSQELTSGENGAVKVTYRFGDGWKFLRLAPKNAELTKIEGQPKEMAVRVNADGSGNTVRLRFRDSEGQFFQVNGERMAEKDTQYFTFDMTGQKNTHRWGGPNDGVIRYPIFFDSLVVDGTRKATGPHEIEIFPPVMVYGE